MSEKEKMIAVYMSKLDLSREEAEQMWLDEQEDNLPDLTTEQKAVVKEMTQADRKKETAPRKRERKADEDKRFLIEMLATALFVEGSTEIEKVNVEREIAFTFNGNRYRLTLAKPREKKG